MVFFCFLGEAQQAASSLSRVNLRFTLWFLLHFGMQKPRFMGWRTFGCEPSVQWSLQGKKVL
jgi:hypothetical protein